MPIHCEIRNELKLVIVTHVGAVPDQEFLLAYKELFYDDNYDLSCDLLVDLRRTDCRRRSSEALKILAGFTVERFQETGFAPKIAVIAPDDLSYGLCRVYDAFASAMPGEFIVFRSAEKALDWLQVPSDIIPIFSLC